MKRCIGLFVLLLLLSCLFSCKTENTGTMPNPSRDAAFSIINIGDDASFMPELIVDEQGTSTVVTVMATAADDLSEAFVHLHYDTSTYSPQSIDFGDFLGTDNRTVTIGLTDVADIVPIGIAQVASSGVIPVSGDGVLASVRFKHEAFVASRSAASAPTGDPNKVMQLDIIDQTATTATLRWTETNKGDYNNDSMVNISDITSVAAYYGLLVDDTDDPLKAGLADGDGDGMVTIADITQIAQNWGNVLSGYKLYLDVDGTDEYGSGITCTRAAALVTTATAELLHPIKYTCIAEVPVGEYIAFTVRPMDAADLGNPGTVSAAATMIIDPDPPLAPTGFTALSDEDTGHKTVSLNWTASASVDVEYYVLARRQESVGTWDDLVQLAGSSTSYNDTDAGLQESEDYTYRIHSLDVTSQSSPYVEAGPVTPFFVQPPDAPTNVNAHGGTEIGSIEVTWDAPADDSDIFKYRVYGKGPLDVDFSEVQTTFNKYVTDYTQTELTVGETYEYYVVSVGSFDGSDVESAPSATVDSTPSDASPISITDLTTDKTTHFNGTSSPPEAGANLTVTTSIPPTSVEWSATGGTLTPNGSTATWERVEGMNPEMITITCTVHSGPLNDVDTLKLYVTEKPIMTEYGNNGKYMTGAPCDELLEKLIDGGGKITGRQFESYMTPDKVTFLSTFDTGCTYCKKEFPFMDDWCNQWNDFQVVLDCCDGFDKTKTFFQGGTNGVVPVDMFDAYCFQMPGSFQESAWWTSWGLDGSFPEFVVLDRDGYVREHKAGFWGEASMIEVGGYIEQLIGTP